MKVLVRPTRQVRSCETLESKTPALKDSTKRHGAQRNRRWIHVPAGETQIQKYTDISFMAAHECPLRNCIKQPYSVWREFSWILPEETIPAMPVQYVLVRKASAIPANIHLDISTASAFIPSPKREEFSRWRLK